MSEAIVEMELADPIPPRPARPPRRRSRPSVGPGSRPSPARAAAAARLVGADPEAAAAAATASALARPLPEPDPSETTKPAPHLRVVEAPKQSPAQRRRRARAMLLGGAGLMVTIAFGLVYLHVAMAQRQFTLDHLSTQVQAQQADYQTLRLKVAQLDSPQNVISVAVGKLGMHQPTSVNYLAPTTTVGQPAAPSTSTIPSSAGANSVAPAGDANWPRMKSQLAGIP